MQKRLTYPIVVTTATLMFLAGTVQASTHDFYKGKIIRIIVGFRERGAFDTYSRAIARYMTRHIPGNPTVVVENMPGYGSLTAANYAYKQARPDGLTIVGFVGALVLQQLLGRREFYGREIEFDAQRYEWLGVPVLQNIVCALTKGSGITNLEQWNAASTPVKLGGTGAGTPTDDTAKVLKEALGLPVRLVSGYKATTEVVVKPGIIPAAELGEIAGACWEWETMKLAWRKALDKGDVIIVLQVTPRPQPDLPNVPLAVTLAKTDEARLLIQAVHEPYAMGFLYALPPGTPKEQVVNLRKAFIDTIRDPDFLAHARNTKLDINPLSGEEVEKAISGILKLEPAMIDRLKEILR